MPLEDYQRKRDFRRTSEPRGRKRSRTASHRFVVHKHAARRLHYDLRLEFDGGLWSWAVPKGPSLDPAEKRLAVQTEDHPLEYANFEGVIPHGEYGAGTVMLWDRGTWRMQEQSRGVPGGPRAGYDAGKLKFELDGEKLCGGWTLVRLKGDAGGGGKTWLLIKERDAHARPESEFCVLDELPYSALTKRTMREITEGRERAWTSSDPRSRAAGTATSAAGEIGVRDSTTIPTEPQFDASDSPHARRTPQPAHLNLALPAQADEPPAGDGWLHEIELRGLRLAAFLRPDRVVLRTAGGEDWTARLPEITQALGALPLRQAILDGVATVADERGIPSESALEQAVESGRTSAVVYHVFDLPYCEGCDLRRTPLLERKRLLHRIIETADPPSCVQYHDHIQGNGAVVYEHARELGVPGLVSKRADSRYVQKRTQTWLSIPCIDQTDSGSIRAAAVMRRPDRAITDPARIANRANSGAPLSYRSPGRTPARPGAVVEPGLDIRGVRITNPGRILYSEERITKRELAVFYEQIADWVLPHVAGRPLSLYRCPAGHEKECFFQKHLGDMSVKHLRESPLREREGKDPYIVIDGAAGLITLAQLAVLEIHPWGCREDDVERPDRMIFDLDPGPDVAWRQVVHVARGLHDLLSELGLASFVKTSGGKGLHVVVPLVRRTGWDELKKFSGAVAKRIVRRDPSQAVATMAKWAREGKVFVDYFRNVRGATCVAAYSTRARAGAAVSTPLHWDELGANPIVYTVRTLPRRLKMLRHDPWEGFFDCRQSITKARKAAVNAR